MESIPDLYLILNAHLKIVEVSQAYLKAEMMARESKSYKSYINKLRLDL